MNAEPVESRRKMIPRWLPSSTIDCDAVAGAGARRIYD